MGVGFARALVAELMTLAVAAVASVRPHGNGADSRGVASGPAPLLYLVVALLPFALDEGPR